MASVDHPADRIIRTPEPGGQRACACGGGCPICQDNPIHVPVEHDSAAGDVAAAADARAVTIRERVYVSPGEYQPHSTRGRELIAHEQIHVAQQRLGRATSDGEVAAAEAEAQKLAPLVARDDWAGVRVTRPAGLVMRDAIPEQDLSEDRAAIRNELEARFPWLSKLSNRDQVEKELVERIALDRRVITRTRALAKLPDPRATILSDEIERRERLRAPVYKKLQREVTARDKHRVWMKIDPMELVSRDMWNVAKTNQGVAAMLRELKKYPASIVLSGNGLDSFRYGLTVYLDGAWLPVQDDGVHDTDFFRAGLTDPMIFIQQAFYAGTADQLQDLMQRWVDLDPSLAERELDAHIAEQDAAENEPLRTLSPEEQEIADYQAANKQYAETVRLKTAQAVAPLILIASFFEIDGPVDLLLMIVPVEKVGAKLFKAGREAVALRRARKLEQALIKEFENHLGDEAREFLKLARGLSKVEVRALKTINEALKNPALIETLMRRAVKGTANLEWIAKKLKNKELDANFVRAFTKAESGPSWKVLEDIVEKRKVSSEARDSLASKLTGLLGEQAAEKLVKTEAFRGFALGARSQSKITRVAREISYGGSKSLDLVALTDKAELVFGEVKHWSTNTWITDKADLLAQLDRHNAGIGEITTRLGRRVRDVKKKVLFVSRDGFMGLESTARAAVTKSIEGKGWTIQLLDNKSIDSFGNLIDRLR